MRRHKDVSAFILAGGASSRMGRNKGLIKIAGEALILRTARLVKPLVSSVTVIGPERPYRRLGLVTIPDKIPGVSKLPAFQGPLAGILTALSALRTQWNLVLACDLPYLSAEWIEALLTRAVRANAAGLSGAYRASAWNHSRPFTGAMLTNSLPKPLRKACRKVTDALARVSMKTIASRDFGESADRRTGAEEHEHA